MTTCLRPFVALTLAAVLGAGCADSVSGPTTLLTNGSVSLTGGDAAVTGRDIRGTWMLRSIHPAGGALMLTPPGASYILTFDAGRLSTRADCNVCNGPFSLLGPTLTAGPQLACTRAACRTMDFERAYTRLLVGVGIATWSGSTMRLSSDRGVLRFTREGREGRFR